jgi:hypothetical protein
VTDREKADIPNYGVREEDAWILQSPAQRILREGELPPEFSAQLAKLHHSDVEKSKALHSLCARLEFIEQLKYTLQVETADPGPLNYQLENLINYLTLTCLDIVAGENLNYMQFPKWFSETISDDPELWPEQLQAGISSIDRAARSGWISFLGLPRPKLLRIRKNDQIAYELSRLIDSLYNHAYLEKFGIRRNIKRLITKSLPVWFRTWLAETFFIIRGEVITLALRDPSKIDWFHIAQDEKLGRIADHLYQSRNKFTHSISPLPPLERPGMISIPYKGVKYRFEHVYRNDDFDSEAEYSVGIKNGLSQSEIVRLITITELRRWASIEDSRDLIDTFLRRSNYRQRAYEFLSELNFNREVILSWQHALLMDRLPGYSRKISRRLSSVYAIIFFELDSNKPSYKGIRFERFDEYLELISDTNERLQDIETDYSDLKKSGHWRASQMVFSSFSDLLDADDTKRIIAFIERYKQTLEQTLKTPFY